MILLRESFCVVNANISTDKKIVFMGDDTWTSLYPGHFHEAYPYPSFIVRDLDTVDNGVIKYLLPTIKEEVNNNTGWDVIIAHFLGVDHVGHTFGSNHPAMSKKMLQLDTELKKVMEAIDTNTLLLVMGDHGMTEDGNHGVFKFLLLLSVHVLSLPY